MNIKYFYKMLVFAATANLMFWPVAQANPTGATVINGQVSFSQPNANTLSITNSPNAIINWQGFDIGASELTQFLQQNSKSAVLNRVVSGNASTILGKLQSNGQVFLINPNGLVIGQGAVINTAGFIGSTLNMTDQDFLNGRLHFQGNNAGSIDNQGFIRAGEGGDILLIAPNIENSGILQVEGGNILLAAGESITVSSLDDADISFEVQAEENSVTNLGEIIADDGAANLFAGTLTHTGSISANAISTDEAGNIRLVAQGTNWIEGEVSATSSTGVGGNIHLLGDQVGLDGSAVVDASGQLGGGQILIGGDYQGQGDVQTARASFVGEDVIIKADALKDGNGGEVIVWGNESTKMYGSIFARGGANSGDGGFVETSGGWFDVGLNVPDVSSATGNGGTWLIDPHNIAIIAGGGSTGILGTNPFSSNADNATIGVDVIAAALQGGADVLVQTTNTPPSAQAGNITWANGVTLDLDDVPVQTLTLSAHNDINIDGNITYQGGIAQGINLTIIADSDSDGTGAFNLGATGDLLLTDNGSVGALDISAGGNIVLDGNINTNGGSITLNTTNGTISQALSASTNANDLVVTVAGDLDFQGANSFTNLNVLQTSPGNITFFNTGALSIDVISAAGSTVTLNNTGAIDQVGAIGGIIGVASLDVTATGDITLDNSGNSVTSINANSGGNNVTFVNGSALSVDAINATGGAVVLNNTGTVDQAGAAGGILAASLDITSTGDITLNNNANNLASLNADSGGNNFTLNNNNTLLISNLNASGGAVILTNSGAINQTGAVGGIQAASLNITGNNGNVTLNDTRNDVDSLTGTVLTAGGSDLFFAYTDQDDVEIQNVTVSNSSTSPPDNSFLDIVSGGNMTLNGNVTVSGPSAGGSGVTLVAQNGADIIYQSGTITTDTINFQNDAISTTTGAVGSALNPIHTASTLASSTIDINHGSNGGSGPALSGGDLFLLNTVGNLSLASYMTPTASDIQIENSVGDLDLMSTSLIDSSGGTTDELLASSIRLIASGDLFLPSLSMVRPPLESRLVSTSGEIYLQARSLAINNQIQSAGNVTLVSSSGALQIQNTVDSSAGNVELISDSFSISAGVTAMNQVVVREYSAASGLEINNGVATSGFASLTTSDLRFLTGTNQGLVLGNDLMHTGAKTVQVIANLDSSLIDGTALTIDTTNNSSGSSTALVAANLDFTADNENLVFTGGGDAIIQSSAGTDVRVDTGSGDLNASGNLSIMGSGNNSVIVRTRNASISGDLVVSSDVSAGSSAVFEGSALTVGGSTTVTPLGDIAEVNFSGSANTGNLDPIPELNSLFNNFTAQYVEPAEDDDEEEELLVCR